jgi:PAS domain S-box-containing protein
MSGAVLPLHPGLEALPDGFYTLDPDWRLSYWNAAAERLFGLPRAEVLGRHPWDVLPGTSESELRERLAPVMEGGAAVAFSVERRAGEPRLAADATPVEGGGAAVLLREDEPQARLAEQYERVLESIHDGFVAVDAAWRVVYVNRPARALLSLRPGRVLGADLRTLLPGDPPSIREAIQATMTQGAAHHLAAVQPSGRVFRGRPFDVWTSPLPGGGLSILFEDVSERVERERELARLAAEAEEASRAKSRFFAAVSHELRTPLNAIVGYTHLLGTGTYGEMPEGAERAAERAGVCAEHLARLVDDVLLLTTTEVDRLPVAPREVALDTYLPSTLEPLRRQAEAKGLAFVLDLPAGGAASLETDPERLRQLLQTLVSNAIKFTSRGEVRVTVSEARVRPRPPVSSTGQPGGASRRREVSGVEIAVADQGPGIAPEERERIFDAFEQLGDPSRHDSMNRGTGLGLTIARQLTKLLCGTLGVDEQPGGGSVFRLRLPRRFGGEGEPKS